MKKFFSLFLLFAMTVAGLMVSCGSDDPVANEPEKVEPEPTYAKLFVKLSEDIFEYSDFVVTLKYDNEIKTYKMSELKTTEDAGFEGYESFSETGKIAGRVLEVPVFEYKALPVEFKGEFVISEEGQKKIDAATPEKEEIDIFYVAGLYKCAKDGSNPSANPNNDKGGWRGVYVHDLPDFLKTLVTGTNASLFKKSL